MTPELPCPGINQDRLHLLHLQTPPAQGVSLNPKGLRTTENEFVSALAPQLLRVSPDRFFASQRAVL